MLELSNFNIRVSTHKSSEKIQEAKEMIGIIISGLYWLAMFCSGFIFGRGITESAKTTLMIAVGFCLIGITLYFYQLAVGAIGLPTGVPSSAEAGILGSLTILFFGSSLGLGYLAGRIEKRRQKR